LNSASARRCASSVFMLNTELLAKAPERISTGSPDVAAVSK
jgi:hypothetical protein